MIAARHVVGCMTGTSMDGIDAALVRIEGHGLGMRAALVRWRSAPLDVRGLLRELTVGSRCAAEFARAARQLGEVHAEVIGALLEGESCEFVAIHGQTVYHAPPDSWQLLNPWPIAAAIGVPVVYDLRGADLAVGGEGAPITPLADWVLFRDDAAPRTVLNLGGFASMSVIPSGCTDPYMELRGRDISPCNHALDAVARARLDRPFDAGGASAAAGVSDARISAELSLRFASVSDRSLGSGDESAEWAAEMTSPLSPADACATVCDAVSAVVADATPLGSSAIVAGGGALNSALMDGLRRRLGRSCVLSDAHGVPAQAREAVCMAVLGALMRDRVATTVPGITRARRPVMSGAWVLP